MATTDHEAPALVVPELDAGTRLGDRYRLIGRLGAGGGGTVWRAFDEKVAEELALKLVEASADVERWRREVALARRISHPNVCRVYDLGEAGGRRWVTMELVGGDSLRTLLERGVPAAERHRLMSQLVDAVAAIHAAGVVHRDLKPENVVVDGRGRAVIVDFGLAKTPAMAERAGGSDGPRHADLRVTREGAVLGTPRYMAPEQAEGKAADARSDVYALGLVLFEITGGSPPEPWAPLIERCMASAAAERFADGGALRAALATPRRWVPRWALIGGVVTAVAAGSAALAFAFAGGRGGGAARPWTPGAVTVRRLTTSTPDRQPTSAVLSPDGKRLAYTVGAELYVRDVDGGVAAPVTMPLSKFGTPITRQVLGVGWFPDGRIAVLIYDRDDAWGIYAVGGGEIGPALYQTAARPVAALSPDGRRLAVAVRDRGVVVVSTEGRGKETQLVAAGAGELVGGLAWSPDGRQLALVRYPADWSGDTLERVNADGGGGRVLARGRFAEVDDQLVAWPAPDRLVYATPRPGGGASLLVLALRGGEPDGEPVAAVSWPGEHVARGSAGGGRLVVMRGTATDQVMVSSRFEDGHIGVMKPALIDGSPARRLAGWTPGGLVFAMASAAGDHDIVERGGDGTIRTLVGGPAETLPDTVVDGAVLFHRGDAEALEIWRHDSPGVGFPEGRDVKLTTIPSDAAAANVVRCAGDRTTPCIVEEVAGDAAIYRHFDPATGARGDEVYRARVAARAPRNLAVSPDGAVLALVDGSSTLTTVALAGGAVTRRQPRPGAELGSVTWSRDGEALWLTADGGGRHLHNVLALERGETRAHLVEQEDVRWFWRPQESPDGAQIALQIRDTLLEAWLIEGL